jgi:hypothetical protein
MLSSTALALTFLSGALASFNGYAPQGLVASKSLKARQEAKDPSDISAAAEYCGTDGKISSCFPPNTLSTSSSQPPSFFHLELTISPPPKTVGGFDWWCEDVSTTCCFGSELWQCIPRTAQECCTTGYYCPTGSHCYLGFDTVQYCVVPDEEAELAAHPTDFKPSQTAVQAEAAQTQAAGDDSSSSSSSSSSGGKSSGKKGGKDSGSSALKGDGERVGVPLGLVVVVAAATFW